MTGLLDQIVANTGPRILSEQHDLNQISTDGMGSAGGKPSDRLRRQIASIRPGGWDAAEYGISAAAQVAKLETALAEALAFEATPEGFALAAAAEVRAMAEMRQRAVRRASLDTSNGKVAVMVAGKAPWHKLGVNVAEAVNSVEAIRLASLDWNVEKTPLNYKGPDGTVREAPGVFGIVRQDTGAMLGSVGKIYKPIQNVDGFEFLDGVLGKFGAKYESAGAIYGGTKVWMLVHLPGQAFTVGSKDKVEPYAIFTNSHDGMTAARCYPTSERVVCANTFRIAQASAGGISIKHFGNLKGRMADAQRALGVAVEGFADFAEKSQVLASTPVNIRHYANDVLDAVLEVTAAEATKGADVLAAALQVTEAQRDLDRKSFERKIERRGEVLEDILTRYDSERCGLNGARGTAWAAFNAVTEHADHSPLYRYIGSDETRASRRFESVLNGPADELKQVAYAKAISLAS